MTGPHANPDLRNAERGLRLQKAMAEAGVASRRACEELIEEGRVRVNGNVVRDLPAWVDPREDSIEVDGQEIARPRRPRGKRSAKNPTLGKHYVLLHKPRGVLCTNRDPDGRPTAVQLVAGLPGNPRLFPVGRLDADSTGLLLLTDDGDLAYRLTHPSFEVPKTYRVRVAGEVTERDLARLRQGLYLADRTPGAKRHAARRAAATGQGAAAKKARVEKAAIIGREVDRARGSRTTLRLTLEEGQNREIRRLLARVGFRVRKLQREAIGPLRLGGLAPGAWRTLESKEVRSLYHACGLR
ncbi:MAG: pseudouridine synthase [Planctomycetota bacterium]